MENTKKTAAAATQVYKGDTNIYDLGMEGVPKFSVGEFFLKVEGFKTWFVIATLREI